jgi:hypothetical protein
MLFITKDTLSTINRTDGGTWILKFYKEGKTVFRKEYESFNAAKIAEGKLMKKFY